jgi:hypothetical protein
MTINLYKEGRGRYKLVVFTNKYGVETFKVKGKKDARKKMAAIKLLYDQIT